MYINWIPKIPAELDSIVHAIRYIRTSKRQKKGCAFQLNFNKNSEGIYVISRNSIFEHSHPLNKPKEKPLDESINDEVYNMKKIGISNFHIIRFIETKFGISITQNEINSVFRSSKDEDMSETEMMINFMNDKGKCLVFEDINGSIAGIYTVTNEEESDLKQLGDFIVLDGTTIPNFLNWTIIPVSLQGNNGELKSGGIAFTPSENRDFYYWLIQEILSISKKLLCILSDEDSGICSAANDFSNLCHMLCIKHKISSVLNLV